MIAIKKQSKQKASKAKAILKTTAIAVAVAGVLCTSAQAQNEKKLTIGLALYSQVQMRWQYDAKAFQEQASKNGDNVILQYADSNPSMQTQQVQNMLSRGIDVLVIASADVAVGATLIDKAKAQGVKTIVYDIGVKDTAADWMIVRSQEQVGTLQVQAVLTPIES